MIGQSTRADDYRDVPRCESRKLCVVNSNYNSKSRAQHLKNKGSGDPHSPTASMLAKGNKFPGPKVIPGKATLDAAQFHQIGG